jgi:hypothetical protein
VEKWHSFHPNAKKKFVTGAGIRSCLGTGIRTVYTSADSNGRIILSRRATASLQEHREGSVKFMILSFVENVDQTHRFRSKAFYLLPSHMGLQEFTHQFCSFPTVMEELRWLSCNLASVLHERMVGFFESSDPGDPSKEESVFPEPWNNAAVEITLQDDHGVICHQEHI